MLGVIHKRLRIKLFIRSHPFYFHTHYSRISFQEYECITTQNELVMI